jgi:hypothetical protein
MQSVIAYIAIDFTNELHKELFHFNDRISRKEIENDIREWVKNKDGCRKLVRLSYYKEDDEMSMDFGYIETMDGRLNLTQLWGGADHGVAVQLTPDSGNNYITLSKANCYDLINALHKVFDEGTIEEDKLMSKQTEINIMTYLLKNMDELKDDPDREKFCVNFDKSYERNKEYYKQLTGKEWEGK